MKKNDVVIKVNPENREVYFNDNFAGVNAENLQSNLVFEFDGEFVNGTPRVEVEKDREKYIITDVSKVEDTYVMEIKSSLLTTDIIWLQLVITEVGEEEIPIFKSRKFYLVVKESINADTELPDEYATLYDQIEEKIAEADNLDIDAEKVDDTTTVTITKKDGTKKEVEINDGYTPQKGVDYWTNEDKQEMEQDIVNDVLVDYSLKVDTGHSLDVSIDSSTYVMTLNLKNTAGTIISTQTVDLPLESVVVSGRYDSANKQIILELQNGNTINIPVGDLISGLQEEITTDNKLASDLVDDTNQTNKFVTASEKTTWNNKSDFSGDYDDLTNKPNIPTKTSELTNDSGYVKRTDYPTYDNAGVVKRANQFDVNNTNGQPYCSTVAYENYPSLNNSAFISKGTLENVITGKGLVSNTNYASSSTAGVVKPYNYLQVSSNGQTYADTVTYANYGNVANQTFISKGTLENVIEGKELLSSSDVENNVVSTDEDKPLSANMGKELNDRIQNLASIGKYLAMWDCTTGLPTTDPVTMPYTYTTGDYYVISNIGQTNYMPNSSTYTHTASTTQYSGTDTLNVGDFFYYDGTVWTMLKNTGKTVYFANIAGSPMDNSNLASALNNKVGFTDYATTQKAGVVKLISDRGLLIDSSNGGIYPETMSYSDYSWHNVNTFIGKGTLENVLGARFITLTQAEYDALVTKDANTYYFIEEE